MRGSTSGTTDSAGTLTSTISYFSFGAICSSTGSSPTDKKFTGQILDNTGLYYYNARYYDPAIGRFISADTIVPNPANPQSLNRYSYCLNNPLKYIDPTGHMDDYDLGLDIPDDYGDYVDAYNYGFESSYTGWKNNGSPTVTIDGTTTTITISSGKFVIVVRTPVMSHYEKNENIEIEQIKGYSSGQAQGLAALEGTISGLEYARTQDEEYIISFIATVIYDSSTSKAQYIINIESPNNFEFTPSISDYVMGLNMETSLGYNLPNHVGYSGSRDVYFEKSNYLSHASISLSIDYVGGNITDTPDIFIDFATGTWYGR